MVNLRVSLAPNEADALAELAYSELRDPRDQIRVIVRLFLESRGLLQPAQPALISQILPQVEAQNVTAN